jgi:hypothetical protein
LSQSDEDRWYWATGDVIGSIGGLIAFVWICFAAINSVGWVVGIALGWIPAGLGALACYLLVRILWLPAIGLIALAFLNG